LKFLRGPSNEQRGEQNEKNRSSKRCQESKGKKLRTDDKVKVQSNRHKYLHTVFKKITFEDQKTDIVPNEKINITHVYKNKLHKL
jgi:hypothetical protein